MALQLLWYSVCSWCCCPVLCSCSADTVPVQACTAQGAQPALLARSHGIGCQQHVLLTWHWLLARAVSMPLAACIGSSLDAEFHAAPVA